MFTPEAFFNIFEKPNIRETFIDFFEDDNFQEIFESKMLYDLQINSIAKECIIIAK